MWAPKKPVEPVTKITVCGYVYFICQQINEF